MWYIGAIRFPLRVFRRFVTDYPESAHVAKAVLKSFLHTYKVWRGLAPKLGSDFDHNGKLFWKTARSEWAPRIEECGQLKIVVIGSTDIDWDRRYVVAVNHASTLDTIAVVKAVPDGVFVAKSNVVRSRYPVIGTAVRKGGQLIIERGDTAQAIHAINEGMRKRPRASPIFFVEGTRSPDGRIAAFKKGAFRLAIDHGLAILPIVISGSHNALPKGTLMGLRRGSTIYVRCLEPIETRGMTGDDIPGLMEHTRNLRMDVYYGYSCNPRL
jgi:1-acyl-sn-glycerol-3-phosphate acyltransferase